MRILLLSTLLLAGCAGVRVYVPDGRGGKIKAAEITSNGPYSLTYNSGPNKFILSGTADCATATIAQGTAALQVIQGSATLVGSIGTALATKGLIK